MITKRTILNCADNSGALKLQCIGFVGLGNRNYATLGDTIVCSIKKAEPNRQLKPGNVVRAIVVRQKKPFRRKNGTWIRFEENACVIINERGELVGNRIFGPLPREIKEKGFIKIANLAEEIV